MSIKVVIVGASGFVGKALIERFLKDPSIQIRAIARSFLNENHARIEKQKCDLFSLLDIERALEGQDVAIYLVHSMLPSSQLSQGGFEDYDLILADNFAQAAKKQGIKRILYLGGIIPTDYERNPETLSPHLRSRLEVENVFRSTHIPLIALRAGMLSGAEGSSFQILLRLVQRLPLMICPSWTQQKSSPIHVRDVAESFYFLLKNDKLNGSFDLTNEELLSYLEMLQIASKKFNRNIIFIKTPYLSPRFSKLWVRLISGAPKNLVYPLVDSLKHNMCPNPDNRLVIPEWNYTSFEESLEETLTVLKQSQLKVIEPKAYRVALPENRRHIVQSVQRHKIPQGKNAIWASEKYVQWLNENFNWLIKVKTTGPITQFYLAFTKILLLELTMSKERSYENRILFYITGGLLDKGSQRGRLEFRITPDGEKLITAIHDFRPSLPWYVYKYTQALLHASVMRRFGKHLHDL